MQVKAKLVAAPLYFITVQALDKNEGVKLLEKAIEKSPNQLKLAAVTVKSVCLQRLFRLTKMQN